MTAAGASGSQNDRAMAVQITIREVPESVRDELASRAAAEGKSMQQFLLAVLERAVEYPCQVKLMERIRERVRASKSGITTADILAARDEERR